MEKTRRSFESSTSTPKRRRLGPSRIIRNSLEICRNNASPQSSKPEVIMSRSTERQCESPLPCNQVEFLYSSKNSSCNDYPASPDIIDCSMDFTAKAFEKSFTKFTQRIPQQVRNYLESPKPEIGDGMPALLENEMFQTFHEPKNTDLMPIPGETFKEETNNCFESVNKSICDLNSMIDKNDDMFETKDSFLLDIKESSIILEDKKKLENIKNNNVPKMEPGPQKRKDPLSGLPSTVDSLFKSCRNIDKFYDWQNECLTLDAITHRQNLIYSLPTSGGKTLVAEVLMLKEVLVRRKNALFILPFVAIVQEKIWALSPFAVQLDFLIEEYAAGKGHIPPKKRRKKNSIYIATIEKGLALVRSLIELDRLQEIGLVVVDELHLIGEPGRGGNLETLLSTILIAKKEIQIVGMSATIGNLAEVGSFLNASVFERNFRPVELQEYVKLGPTLYRMSWEQGVLDLQPERDLHFDYTPAATALDPDFLGGLVSEVTPEGSVLVFCPTKRNCENVAALLSKIQRKEMTNHRVEERLALCHALSAEGAAPDLVRCVRFGIGYHHAGLGNDERALLESAFRSGVVSVVACTSTLAAGVNLPARRVIVRAPRVAGARLSAAHYRQMCGRAGRAGHTDTGESIILCSESEWQEVRATLSGGVSPALTQLHRQCASFVLSCLWLKLAATRTQLRQALGLTLMAVQAERLEINIKQVCDDAIRTLVQSGAVEIKGRTDEDATMIVGEDLYVCSDSELCVSTLGSAAIKGCLEIPTARQLIQDLDTASRSLVVRGSCHLLYLLTPHDALGVHPDYRHYYNVYSNMDECCLQTANVIGITEKCAIRMFTGRTITNIPEIVLRRFYLALVLYDLWNQVPLPAVADKYLIARGTVQSLMTSAASLAWSAHRLTSELPAYWTFAALFSELATKIVHCQSPEIETLMELPSVKKGRAMQLYKSGYKRIEDIAKASVEELTTSVSHLSRQAATHLVSAARMMLIEKVENLRAEAEDVMEDLKI